MTIRQQLKDLMQPVNKYTETSIIDRQREREIVGMIELLYRKYIPTLK